MFNHTTQIHLRFFDMDAFGHINNARYLTYFEEARIKYLDDVIKKKYEWSGQGVILANVEIDFKAPGHFKDKVSIVTRCSHIGNKSFNLEHRMIKTEKKEEFLLATASTVVVMFDYENNVTIPVPEEWKNAFRKYEGL